jgi:hypothetical protein
MQQTRKVLTILGGAALMSLMLGVAAFAFSAAVQPALLENPAAIVVGFAAAADAQAASIAPIVTGVPSVQASMARPNAKKDAAPHRSAVASGARASRTGSSRSASKKTGSGSGAGSSAKAPGSSPSVQTPKADDGEDSATASQSLAHGVTDAGDSDEGSAHEPDSSEPEGVDD